MKPLLPAGRLRDRFLIPVVAVAAAIVLAVVAWRQTAVNPELTAVIHRGDFTPTLTTTGTLRAIESLTYRSPVPGRELEIVELVSEGTHVNEGDMLVRLDCTELEKESDRL